MRYCSLLYELVVQAARIAGMRQRTNRKHHPNFTVDDIDLFSLNWNNFYTLKYSLTNSAITRACKNCDVWEKAAGQRKRPRHSSFSRVGFLRGGLRRGTTGDHKGPPNPAPQPSPLRTHDETIQKSTFERPFLSLPLSLHFNILTMIRFTS